MAFSKVHSPRTDPRPACGVAKIAWVPVVGEGALTDACVSLLCIHFAKIAETLHFDRVAPWIEKEHRRLLAGLALQNAASARSRKPGRTRTDDRQARASPACRVRGRDEASAPCDRRHVPCWSQGTAFRVAGE